MEFSQGVESLFTEAQLFIDGNMTVDDEKTGQELDSLESFVLEHSTRIRFSVKLQLLSIVQQKRGRLIRQMLYGFDDCTIPPIGNHCVSVRYGHAGRPLLAVNIELIEFLRNCGYTWQQL